MKVAAIILLLNGVQIEMPAPALLIDGRAWVPLRPVAERLGWKVSAASGRVAVGSGDRRVDVAEARVIEGRTYVPARWLEKLGAKVSYIAATRTVAVEAQPAPGEPVAVTIGQLLADPAGYAGRMVTAVGEFMGYLANPLLEALRFGPPVSTGDWVLRGEGGAVYCVGPRPFDYPALLGRRCRVEGMVDLSERAAPFIRVGRVELLTGRQALCCCILTDRFRYRVGEKIELTLLVRNDGDEPIEATFPSSQIYDFRLLDAEGRVVWQWSRGKKFAMMLSRRTFQPGHAQRFRAAIEPSAEQKIGPGIYYAEGEIVRLVRSYREKIEVAEER